MKLCPICAKLLVATTFLCLAGCSHEPHICEPGPREAIAVPQVAQQSANSVANDEAIAFVTAPPLDSAPGGDAAE
jgi:hypothetical protein